MESSEGQSWTRKTRKKVITLLPLRHPKDSNMYDDLTLVPLCYSNHKVENKYKHQILDSLLFRTRMAGIAREL